MAKQSRSQLTMAKVVDEVTKRLIEGDESDIRIPEICEASGVNYGSVYHHFGNRQGVINAAYARLFEDLADVDIQIIEGMIDQITNFDEFAAVTYHMFTEVVGDEKRKRERYIRLRIFATCQTEPDLKEAIAGIQKKITDRIANVIAVFIKNGWMRSDVDPLEVAVAVQTITFGRLMDEHSSTPLSDLMWNGMLQSLLYQYVKFPTL
jgi:AcrR family transcriptional regulator